MLRALGIRDFVIVERVELETGPGFTVLTGETGAGHAATLAQLREAGEHLVDIRGHHEHQSVLRGAAQRNLLDAHAGAQEIARDCADAWHGWKRLEAPQDERAARFGVRGAAARGADHHHQHHHHRGAVLARLRPGRALAHLGPVAASIVWGIGFSTVLTLFAMPLLYWALMPEHRSRRGRPSPYNAGPPPETAR